MLRAMENLNYFSQEYQKTCRAVSYFTDLLIVCLVYGEEDFYTSLVSRKVPAA